jgi:hypothetical protein
MGEEADARLFAAREVGKIERDIDRSILDLSGDLLAAINERNERQREALRTERTGPAVQPSPQHRGESAEQAYFRIQGAHYDAAQDAARQQIAKMYEQRAAEARTLADTLREKEPRRILGFGKERWTTWKAQREEAEWQERLNMKRAKESLTGEHDWHFNRQALAETVQAKTAKEYPELYEAYQREKADKEKATATHKVKRQERMAGKASQRRKGR